MKAYSGYNCNTAQSLMLGAGAYFKNFRMGIDNFKTALQQGKCLGATKDGGTFVAKPNMRAIEIDGVKTVAKGLQVIDSWDVSMQANVIELTKETLRLALANGVIDTTSNAIHDIITAKSDIAESDYLDNVTWLGKLSGSDEPVIIQIYNALNTEGINTAFKDKGEGAVSMTFVAHQDCKSDMNVQPFAIFYPKALVQATVEDIDTMTTELKGTGLVGSTIYVTGGTLEEIQTTVGTDGTWTAEITKQVVNTIIYITQVANGSNSDPITMRVSIVAPNLDSVIENDTEVSGTGIPRATVQIYDEDGTIPAGTTAIVGKDNTWSIRVAKLEVDNVIYAIQWKDGNISLETSTTVGESEVVE